MKSMDDFNNLSEKDITMVSLVQGRFDAGTPDEECYWAYVALYPETYEEFKTCQNNGIPCKLTDYGVILASATGEYEPSEDIKQEMEAKYNIDRNFESRFRQAVDRLQKLFSKGP